MTYFLFGTAILGGLIFKKSHIASIYIVSVILLLSVYKYNVADLFIYKSEYEIVLSGNAEQFKYIGHYFLAYLCKMVKMTFYQYLFVYYSISFMLMYIAISRLTVNVNMVMSLYLLYPFGIDAIQMKTMMADAWVLLGLSYLIQVQEFESNRLKNIILFVLFSVTGSLFHFSVSFFIPVCFLLMFIDIKKYKIYILILEIALVVAIYLNVIPKILLAICNKLHIGNAVYMLIWLERKTRMGWIVPTVGVVICIACSLLIKNNKNMQFKKDNAMLSYECLIYSACFLLPFFLYDVTFVRLMRVYLIIIYVQFARRKTLSRESVGVISMNTQVTFQKVVSIVTLLALIGYMYWYEIYPNNSSTLGGLLRYNSII